MAALCVVRNSVGENSYVADEIVTSRAGVRLRLVPVALKFELLSALRYGIVAEPFFWVGIAFAS